MINILVVEDERAISNLIKINLEDAGYIKESAVQNSCKRA